VTSDVENLSDNSPVVAPPLHAYARVMDRHWTQEDHEQPAQRIEQWIAEAHRMWVGGVQVDSPVRRVQDKLIAQRDKSYGIPIHIAAAPSMSSGSNGWILIAVVALVWIALLIMLGVYIEHGAAARSNYSTSNPPLCTKVDGSGSVSSSLAHARHTGISRIVPAV